MRVVTLGEMMIRFMPKNNLRLEQATEFDAFYGGDESIVAVSLARYGLQSLYVTRLPENPLGFTAAGKLREQGVETGHIAWGGERLGLNFYENGAAVRQSSVLYDRKGSAFAESVPKQYDLAAIFTKADWFHVSGITPALGPGPAHITKCFLEAAKNAGATTSLDLNFRGKLWSQQQAQAVMVPLMEHVDVCIGGREDAQKMLGMQLNETTESLKPDITAYKELFALMKEKFGFTHIASTLREGDSSSDNAWSALLYDGDDFYETTRYQLHLVDRGGGGASFSAGLIYGLLNGFSLRDTGEFAIAASALKQTIPGDFNLTTLQEVKTLMQNGSNGRVQR